MFAWLKRRKAARQALNTPAMTITPHPAATPLRFPEKSRLYIDRSRREHLHSEILSEDSCLQYSRTITDHGVFGQGGAFDGGGASGGWGSDPSPGDSGSCDSGSSDGGSSDCGGGD
jgi:hypothetical protein